MKLADYNFMLSFIQKIRKYLVNRTIFDTSIIKEIMKLISLICLKAAGWQVKGTMPDTPKCVIIAAPHTSNWDLPFTLFGALILKINFCWMGKETIFKRPFGTIMKWLGGIPIDRSQSNNTVQQYIEQFKGQKSLNIAIPPSGTRQRVMVWKTGFYYIATGAEVPIVLGYLDYKHKVCGLGPTINPTGDIDKDMAVIRAFYKTITGKYPEKVRL